MLPSENELKQTYGGFPDEKLIKIATQQARDLRPEALEILEQELQKRGLLQRLQESIALQFRQGDERVIARYCELIRRLPCPHCNATTDKLNATMTGEVMSIVFYTHYAKKLKVACPDCLDRANNTAMLKSAALGWWAVPWGIIRTVQSLLFNYHMKNNNRLDQPTDVLKEVVSINLGEIEMARDNEKQLQALVAMLTL